MPTRERNPQSSPFGRSPRLLECYQMIGASLLEHERHHLGLGSMLDLSHCNTPFPIPVDIKSFFRKSREDFEQGVSFVPTEILASYLEDLLDLDVSEEDLFIHGQKRFLGALWIAIAGLCFSLGSGLYVVSLGAPLLFSFALTVFLALPFGLLWHYAPRDRHSRRLRFAKLLQDEISRRKGDTGPFVATPLGKTVARKVFEKPSVSSARGGLLGTKIFRIH